jgi:hypothetical protein
MITFWALDDILIRYNTASLIAQLGDRTPAPARAATWAEAA